MNSPVALLKDADQVVGTLSPFRRRLLAALESPGSATTLARRLGTTRQRANYHLRALEKAGFVELQEYRQKRGLTERIMRRTNDVILVDPAAFDAGALPRNDAVGLSGVIALARDFIEQAASVAGEAGPRRKRIVATSLDSEIRLSDPAQLEEMVREIADVIARHNSPRAGLRVRVGTAILPAVK